MSEKQIVVEFEKEKETKNTVRFTEIADSDGMPPKIKTIYLQNFVLKQLGSPDTIKVTIEAG
jgi:hypothetical protein